MLLDKVDKSHHTYMGNIVYKGLMKVWNKFSELIPYQTPIISFIYHPKNLITARCSDFTIWRNKK